MKTKTMKSLAKLILVFALSLTSFWCNAQEKGLLYEITGNVLELSGVDTSSDIIDKKIISKSNDALLDLQNKSIEEELSLYLEEVLNLAKEDIVEVLKVFNDYYTGFDME